MTPDETPATIDAPDEPPWTLAAARARGVGLERVLALSDGVFAIALTLLVLSITVPDLSDPATSEDLTRALGDLIPNLFSYALSFVIIAVYWIVHHRIFLRIRSYDGRLLWLNFALLLVVTFIPFPTAVLGRYGELRAAVILYASTLFAIGLLSWLVWWYATAALRPAETRPPPSDVAWMSARLLAAPAIFLLSIPIAFISTDVAQYSWMLIAVLLVIVGRLHTFADDGAR